MTSFEARWGLNTWLDWQLTQHATAIELGLDRVGEVGRRLDILKPAPVTILVAGTNGKGSSTAWIRALWPQTDHVGVFQSPHLWRYNERITIDAEAASDAVICQAFEAIEQARGDISLTYFEYSALSAMWCFKQARVDMAVLEVGLGGRLDATNIVDADASLITSIGLDHTQWLGDTREQIGREKAGVMRSNRPVVIADRHAPSSLEERADEVGANALMIGRDYNLEPVDGEWNLRVLGAEHRLPEPGIGVVPENFAGAAALVAALHRPLADEQLTTLLLSPPKLPGRCQIVDAEPQLVYDVGHNVEAAAVLVQQLLDTPVRGQTRVVIGMLKDKPVEGVGEWLRRVTDVFYPAGLSHRSPRGLSGPEVAQRLGLDNRRSWSTPEAAFTAAKSQSDYFDRIVVCGSFHTVTSTLNE